MNNFNREKLLDTLVTIIDAADDKSTHSESLSYHVASQLENNPVFVEYENALKNEGWEYRNKETGTVYQVGWDVEDDDGHDVWHSEVETKNYAYAMSLSSRWGVDCKIIRNNPFKEEGK